MSHSTELRADETTAAGVRAAASSFRTTHWSAVLSAGRSDTTRSRAALEELCQNYWQPLYYYIRRQGYSAEDAQDLTQEFFSKLIERHGIAAADPSRGRFRSFLLGSLKNFLADEWDKRSALKRGGGQVFAVDFQAEEARLADDRGEQLPPDKAFERRWAVALLERVYERLRTEAAQAGKGEQFSILRSALMGGRGDVDYARIASEMHASEGAARVAVHRLRQRYREVLRDCIAETVAEPAEIDAELRYLLEVLAG